jgi:endonuclease/exonuclease/phosphatase family metal-dependent hydrolase
MNKNLFMSAFAAVFISQCYGAVASATVPSEEVTRATTSAKLRVMTYNIRNSQGDRNTPNSWSLRKDDLANQVARENLDVIGFQEVLPDQYKWLNERFPEYCFVGDGRHADKISGEYAPVAFRKSRFEMIKVGTFWLSETPDVPGSIGWDAMFPRICSYAILKDKKTGKKFSFANCHTDHRGRVAREKGMLLVVERMKEFGEGAPIVFVGDHNCTEDDAPAKSVRTLLKDAIYLSQTPPVGPWRSCNGWRWKENILPASKVVNADAQMRKTFDSAELKRIDFIYVSPGTKVLDYKTYSESRPGTKLYHSDHFAVSATILF